MKIFVSIKQAGKRKDYITKKELILSITPVSLRELLVSMITMNVTEYNHKAAEPWAMKYLSADAVEDQANTGKVGFGELRNTRQADIEQAVTTAIQAFEDGIYRVFLGENELIALDDNLSINEGDVLTFIRLTMLSGRMW